VRNEEYLLGLKATNTATCFKGIMASTLAAGEEVKRLL